MQVLVGLFAIFLILELLKVVFAWIAANMAVILACLAVGLLIFFIIIFTGERERKKIGSKGGSSKEMNWRTNQQLKAQIHDPSHYTGLSLSNAWRKYRDLRDQHYRRTGVRIIKPIGWKPGEQLAVNSTEEQTTAAGNRTIQGTSSQQGIRPTVARGVSGGKDNEEIDLLLREAKKSVNAVDALDITEIGKTTKK